MTHIKYARPSAQNVTDSLLIVSFCFMSSKRSMTWDLKIDRPSSKDPWWRLLSSTMRESQYSIEKRLFPDIVRTARALLRMSQDELSTCSELSRKTIICIENGQREPDEKTQKAIKYVLSSKGINVDIVDSTLLIGIDLTLIIGDKSIFLEVKSTLQHDDVLSELSNELDSVSNRLKLLKLLRSDFVKE